MSYVMYEMFGRLSRNAFIVLALIIPIVAGMGINFAITIGAMAAQIAALWVIEWGVGGFGGFLLAMLMTMPIAGLFGFLIGKLLNKMKGQEMIGGLILGYFANGLYQLLFLFIFGNLIPLNTPGLVIKGSTGVANTIDLTYGSGGGIKYALDGLWEAQLRPRALHLLRRHSCAAAGADPHQAHERQKGRHCHRHSGGGVPAVSDSRGGFALQHGHGAHGHLPGGRAFVPVQRGVS